ncbi:hypothetical protein FQN60_007190 [Etheostoma spectabile]|uniref:C3H1-type domain-containing protein n=1 Tax=Etheostoma spectabile TaxID=54343 RepID=A0A5J5CFU2_9PERO|nr:hypothetical protein FQN60_007190 [Etheostoma spectabile]
MPKKKDTGKGGAPMPRIRENSRLMRTHETMVDFISGRHSSNSILDVFASGLLGLDFLRTFEGELESDIIYSDDDDDDDDDDDHYCPQHAAHRSLEPHPRIKQLTDEEADKHAKELKEEEERRKEKTKKNKRKKLRKKEKKRIDKENAVKNILPEEEQGKSDSSENQEENPVSENNAVANESPESGKTLNGTAVAAYNESSDNNKEHFVEVNKKEDGEQKKTVDPAAEELAKRSRELAGMGNRLAATGQYEMAVKCFTDAIKYNPKEFKLFGNRSLCYERLQQYENAFRDADLALSMEPNWIKGLFRKGKALCGLKRYYEASLIYKEVLKLESSSAEATQELKRAQTLHLMEMGFTWAQSSEALKTHATLEEAVEALFGDNDACANWDYTDQPVAQEEDCDEGEWTVRQTTRPRMQPVKELDAFGQNRSNSHSPTPHPRNFVKPDLFPIWVGSLAPAVTYSTLHELFSRAGTVYSIKMLLEHQCAFVNYAKKEDCDRAIQCINGMVVEGAPLSVRYPNKIPTGLGMSRAAAIDPYSRPGLYKKECFFWRTTGCTRQDCTYRHVPEHKHVDKDKFTSRLGNVNM